MKQGTLLATPRDDCVSPLGLTIIYRKIGVKSFGLQYPAIRRLQGLKDKQQEVGSLPRGGTTIVRKFRKNRKNDHFLQSSTLKMVGLLHLELPTSTPAGFLINILIMNLLQHIFPQAENLVFQFQKSRGRIFCVFPRLLLLQSKSLRPLLSGEFVGRSSKTQREMRKQWILSGAANGPIQPQNQPRKRKNRPEVRSAENFENGRGERI